MCIIFLLKTIISTFILMLLLSYSLPPSFDSVCADSWTSIHITNNNHRVIIIIIIIIVVVVMIVLTFAIGKFGLKASGPRQWPFEFIWYLTADVLFEIP